MGGKTRVTVALAAIAAIAAGAVFMTRLGADSPDPTSDPDLSPGMPPPPAGMRWVGYADQVVAVPDSWTNGDAPCDVPQSDTVYLASPGEFFCVTPAAVPGVSFVRISPITNGPAFTVDSADLQLEQQIQDSQIGVPDGWATVPWRLHGSAMNMLRELRREGLSAVIVREYRQGTALGNETVPPSGSPVRLGTTIEVVIPVDRPMVIRQAIAAPGDVLDVEFPESSARGMDYVMTQQSSSLLPLAFQLSPVLANGVGTPKWRPLRDRLPVADLGVGGVGPDRVVVPATATPGNYRICIENMSVPLCDVVAVTE